MEPPAGLASAPIRLAIVTNIPAPYRVPVYNLLAKEPDLRLRAYYCARTEVDRAWDLPPFEHDHVFLPGRAVVRAGRTIHYNPSIWRALREFSPDVVLTTGYNPTHLLAWLYAMAHRRAHVAMTDGTDISEAGLSALHRAMRRMVLASSRAGVVASAGGWRLLRSYGMAESRLHVSPLCANTAVNWTQAADTPRDIDILFSGRLVEVKNAGFALEVAQRTAQRLKRRLRVVLLGSGPLETTLRERAAAMSQDVDVQFAGHVSQAEIPGWFMRAKLFLFPTLWDPWGVVANEACQAGVPVLISPHAGAAGELVQHGVNGRVLALDEAAWVDAASQLLGDEGLRGQLAIAARKTVEPFSFENAALGIADAVRQAARRFLAPD